MQIFIIAKMYNDLFMKMIMIGVLFLNAPIEPHEWGAGLLRAKNKEPVIASLAQLGEAICIVNNATILNV